MKICALCGSKTRYGSMKWRFLKPLVREAQAMEHISADSSGSPWRFSADGILLGREDETNV